MTPNPSLDERQLCAPFAKPSLGRALWQLGNTLPLFALLWALMAWTVHLDWSYGWTLLLALPAAGFYVRMFIIQHDCGHGSYFASRRANQWLGACLGLITLFPFGYWKKTHAVHHGTSGNLDRREFGDVRRSPSPSIRRARAGAAFATASIAACRCYWESGRPFSS